MDLLFHCLCLPRQTPRNQDTYYIYNQRGFSLYRVSKKKLMPFQIQISREFHYGTLTILIGIQRTDRD